MSSKGKSGKKKRSISSYVIMIACLGIFVYAAQGLISVLYDYYNNDRVLNNLQDIYYQDSEKEDVVLVSSEKRTRSSFDELREINDELVGWITIADTKIDYPILQADNNVDYLNTNFHGDRSIAGSIFMDYRNDITLQENNFILYGHRVKDGSMFQHLTKYLDEDFFDTHRKFTIDTLYDRYEAEIFAVYNTMIDFNYIQTDFSNEEEFNSLIEGIHQRSIYETDVTMNATDQMITLSTCDYTLDPNNSRLVIHAKLTKIE